MHKNIYKIQKQNQVPKIKIVDNKEFEYKSCFMDEYNHHGCLIKSK